MAAATPFGEHRRGIDSGRCFSGTSWDRYDGGRVNDEGNNPNLPTSGA